MVCRMIARSDYLATRLPTYKGSISKAPYICTSSKLEDHIQLTIQLVWHTVERVRIYATQLGGREPCPFDGSFLKKG